MPPAPKLTAAEAAEIEADWHTLQVLQGRESEAWLLAHGRPVPEARPARTGGAAKGREGVMW